MESKNTTNKARVSLAVNFTASTPLTDAEWQQVWQSAIIDAADALRAVQTNIGGKIKVGRVHVRYYMENTKRPNE